MPDTGLYNSHLFYSVYYSWIFKFSYYFAWVWESVTPLDFSVYPSFGSLLLHWTSPYTCWISAPLDFSDNLLDQHSSGLLRITAGSVLLWTSPFNSWISTPLGFSV